MGKDNLDVELGSQCACVRACSVGCRDSAKFNKLKCDNRRNTFYFIIIILIL